MIIAALASAVAVAALYLSVRVERRLRATEAELAASRVYADETREEVAKAVATAHRSTVDEVTSLLEDLLVHVDNEVTAKVAEALALMDEGPRSGPGGGQIGEHRPRPE